MGFHICEFPHEGLCAFPDSSSGDVTIIFGNGRAWEMPDMILHYVCDHGWVPPQQFINDVMSGDIVEGHRLQTKGVCLPTRIGYLSGDYEFDQTTPAGYELEKFTLQLMKLMKEAERLGSRKQYRGS